MVRVKLCGLRCMNDIALINAYPIDYAGFIFARSPRQVTQSQAAAMIRNVAQAKCVGVFVNQDVEEIAKTADICGLDIIQLHGDESDDDITWLQTHTACEIWKALRIHCAQDLQSMESLHPHRFVLDSYHETKYGGSGICIKDSIVKHIDMKNIILAGGITAENIEEKLAYHPYALDIASGAECNGYKNPIKVEKLMEAIQNYKKKESEHL